MVGCHSSTSQFCIFEDQQLLWVYLERVYGTRLLNVLCETAGHSTLGFLLCNKFIRESSISCLHSLAFFTLFSSVRLTCHIRTLNLCITNGHIHKPLSTILIEDGFTVWRDSEWCSWGLARYLPRRKSWRKFEQFRLTNECWKTFSENYEES